MWAKTLRNRLTAAPSKVKRGKRLMNLSEQQTPVSAETGSSPAVRITVHRTSKWPQVAPIWSDLAESSPHSSFCLSPEWVASWLEVFGGELKPEILVFEAEGVAVGACLLVYRNERVGLI